MTHLQILLDTIQKETDKNIRNAEVEKRTTWTFYNDMTIYNPVEHLHQSFFANFNC